MVQVRYTRNAFLRGMCIIFLFAFLSFYIQIPGLYGENGIVPARSQLEFKTQASLYQKLKQKPTLLWLAPYLGLNVDYMLDILALCGIILSFAGFVSQRFCIAPVFAGLWALYFSLYQIGQIFMWFQWDSLLLEAGFICVFIAPIWYYGNERRSTPSDAVTFWMARWLLFRHMFSSGVVKLSSRCLLWWKLEALNVHFETQFIPTSLAWYAHHLPTWFLRLNTVASNIIEIPIPFLFFFPNRIVRIIAFYVQLFLQVHIIATGNYNFFNFLMICLCVSLLDDQFFYQRKPKTTSNILNHLSVILSILIYVGVLMGTFVYYNLRISDKWTIEANIAFTQEQFDFVLSRAIPFAIYMGMASLGFTIINALINSFEKPTFYKKISTLITTILYAAVACFIFTISIVPLSILQPSHNVTIPYHVKQMYQKTEHLRLVNNYGLYRCKKTDYDVRREVIIEGSDSVEGPWKEYEFLYKPGNVNSSLPFVAPHQPRLDWQMWSAASETYHQHPWIMSFAYRLLNGQPEVLGLINTVRSPFQDKPPKYVKASLYHYHYTPWTYTQNPYAWWTREKIGEYFPIFSRDDPSLLEHLSKMKIITDKPNVHVISEPLKLVLDSLRIMTSSIEASLLIWGVFTAGFLVIITGYSNAVSKRN